MRDILADYSEWLESQPVRASTHDGRCHMRHNRCMIDRMADEVARLRGENDKLRQRLRLADAAIKAEPSHARLSSLVRRFLREIEHVPFRAVDCDQGEVRGLMTQLQQESGYTSRGGTHEEGR